MTDCDHTFENTHSSSIVSLVDDPGMQSHRGLPTHLSCVLTCEDCGEDVTVEWTLAFVDGERL